MNVFCLGFKKNFCLIYTVSWWGQGEDLLFLSQSCNKGSSPWFVIPDCSQSWPRSAALPEIKLAICYTRMCGGFLSQRHKKQLDPNIHSRGPVASYLVSLAMKAFAESLRERLQEIHVYNFPQIEWR